MKKLVICMALTVPFSCNCHGNNCAEECIDSMHAVSTVRTVAESICYDSRATLIPSSDNKSFICRCPGGTK